MNDKVKNLLKERYLVISDFPDSDFKVGEIEDRNWFDNNIVWQISDFPHIFRKLEWWEKRTIEELPDYVKYRGLVYQVLSKNESSVVCEKNNTTDSGLDISWSFCLPADQNDFNKQIKP